MKKHFLLTLALLLLLASCGKTAEPAALCWANQTGRCQLGDTIYLGGLGGAESVVLNGALDTDVRLCHDPLCTHDEEIVCPQSWRFRMRTFLTDGTTVWLCAKDSELGRARYKETGEHVQFSSVYAFDPLASDDMREWVTFETTASYRGLFFAVSDGEVCYKEGFIREGTSGENSETDWGVRVMRVKGPASKPEPVLDRELNVYEQFAADADSFYILSNPAGAAERIAKDGSVRENLYPDGRGVEEVVVTDGGTYLLCDDTARTVRGEAGERTFVSTAVYRVGAFGSEPELILGDAADVVFSDGKIWYSTPEATYHGTAVYPAGTVSMTSETRADVFSHALGDLNSFDPATGETRRWTAERAVDFLGYSAGVALAQLCDYANEVETGERDETVYKLSLNDDGTATVVGSIAIAER